MEDRKSRLPRPVPLVSNCSQFTKTIPGDFCMRGSMRGKRFNGNRVGLGQR